MIKRSLSFVLSHSSRLRINHLCKLTLALTIAQSAHALQREDYGFEAVVKSTAGSALVSVELPLEVYSASRRPGLADLRVINSANEAVPYAFARQTSSAQTGAIKTIEVLPFYEKTTGSGSSSDAVSLTKNGDKIELTVGSKYSVNSPTTGRTLQAYYADLGEKTSIQSLNFNLTPGDDLSAAITIEASDDLKTWRNLANQAPIFRMNRQAQLLSNTQVNFNAQPARYLRITWPGYSEAFKLVNITAQSAPSIAQRQTIWTKLTGQIAPQPPGDAKAEAPNTFNFDAGASFPFTRLNLNFADKNTLAPTKISARKTPDGSWNEIRQDTFFRMNVGNSEASNPDISVNQTDQEYRYWRIQIDPRAGEFQSKIPTLKLGLIPARVVFTARGNPPFTVLIGNAQAEPAALTLDSLVPGTQAGQALASEESELMIAQAVRRTGLSAKEIDRSGEQRKQWIMWASLIAGVGALGFLAMKLLKETPKQN
jgi:hypothetical protein